jgi:hypothetical protein
LVLLDLSGCRIKAEDVAGVGGGARAIIYYNSSETSETRRENRNILHEKHEREEQGAMTNRSGEFVGVG